MFSLVSVPFLTQRPCSHLGGGVVSQYCCALPTLTPISNSNYESLCCAIFCQRTEKGARCPVPGAQGSPAVALPRGAGDFLSGCRFLRALCRRCALCVAAQGATRFLPPGGAFPPRRGLYAFAPSRDVSRGHVTQGQPVRSARAGPGSVWRKEGTGSRRIPAGPGRAVGSGAGGAGPGRAGAGQAALPSDPRRGAAWAARGACSPLGPGPPSPPAVPAPGSCIPTSAGRGRPPLPAERCPHRRRRRCPKRCWSSGGSTARASGTGLCAAASFFATSTVIRAPPSTSCWHCPSSGATTSSWAAGERGAC